MSAPRLSVSLEPPPAHVSEAEYQKLIVDLARWAGWECWHDNDPRRDAAGFPDLLLLRERAVWWEVKTSTGKVRPDQLAFGERLRAAGQAWQVIRPRDWPFVVATLTAEG